jgi:arsenate reductase (thioredoxin)
MNMYLRIRERTTCMAKIKVLFICIHNAARSQMAEALLNHLYGTRFAAESAGLEASGKLNPYAVSVMRELGIDISDKKTRKVFDVFLTGKLYEYVITVCETAAEKCPVFPGVTKRLQWSFPDPATLNGSPEEILTETRAIRDAIRSKIETWVLSLEKSF